jgi:phosphate transport system substrate-binding protein
MSGSVSATRNLRLGTPTGGTDPQETAAFVEVPGYATLLKPPLGPAPAEGPVPLAPTKVASGGRSHETRNFQNWFDPPADPDEIGRLAQYRILRQLGSGGMGVVFLAEDSRLRRLVALKFMKPVHAEDSDCCERFLREARAMAAVKNDHIVTVHEVGPVERPFLAMEFLEGESLDNRLRREPRLPLAEVLRLGRETALALAAAHAKGLIHRDIKPANLWLEAPSGRVKVLDFGLARGAEGEAPLTVMGMILGTPGFMAPEQLGGQTVDARADLFSLGVVLYCLCTGEAPFQGTTTLAVLNAVALTHPKPVQEVNPDLPPALADLVTRLLEKEPVRRPASARAVVEALEAIERSSTVSAPSAPRLLQPAASAPHPAVRRRVPTAAWVALASLLTAAVLVGAFLLSRPAGTDPMAVNSGRSAPDSAVSTRTSVPPSGPRKGPSETGRTSATYTLNGGGSTLVYPLMEKWSAVYRKEKDVKVNYVASGSGGGIQQFMTQALDFACSDAPLTDEQLQQVRQNGGDVLYVPVALGGIVPAYNLEGLTKPLRFSGPVLAGIFLGDIKKWNDPALAEINPGVDLPDMGITVLHRSDTSGSTYIFTDFLSKVSSEWKRKIGATATVKWPVGIGARGNEGLAEALTRRPGSIAYIELLYVLQSKLKFGSVKNKAGSYVQASLETVVAATEGAEADMPPDLRFSLTYTAGKEAYPICGCTWAIIYARQPEGKGQRLVDFLRWVTQDGQEYNTDLYYARLPRPLADLVEQRLMEVKFGE